MTLYDASSGSKDGSVDSSDNDESVDDEDESAYKSDSSDAGSEVENVTTVDYYSQKSDVIATTEFTLSTTSTTTTTTTSTTSTATKELSLDEGTTQLLSITTEFVMPTLGDNGEWSSDSQVSDFSTEKSPETKAEDFTDVPKIPATWTDWVSETIK